MITTMREMFTSTFRRDDVLEWARDTGAIKRLRDIHPADFAHAIAQCAMGDETRSIATARRTFFTLTHYMPEESSFYDRFNQGTVELMKALFNRALAHGPLEQRTALAEALKHTDIIDVEAIDGSQITLPASANENFPSTSDAHGGIKLTAALSVLFQTINDVTLTDAKTHDRKALKLPRWMHGLLCLLDRGYADHGLWATIENRKGFFLTPLKSTSMPTICGIRSGVGRNNIGKKLSGDLRYLGEVDVDAEFNVRKGAKRAFRVVCVPVERENHAGRIETVYLWFVTNLPPEQFSPQQLATLYRFRWEVELMFKALKTVGRLDHLKSANKNVVHTFIYATLLGMVLTHNICALMRRKRVGAEPSSFRVFSLLLMFLPKVLSALGTRNINPTLENFETALWREGVNPNPGRPYRSTLYAEEIKNAS